MGRPRQRDGKTVEGTLAPGKGPIQSNARSRLDTYEKVRGCLAAVGLEQHRQVRLITMTFLLRLLEKPDAGSRLASAVVIICSTHGQKQQQVTETASAWPKPYALSLSTSIVYRLLATFWMRSRRIRDYVHCCEARSSG